MNVDVEELRHIGNKLFDHIERNGVRSCSVEHDYYWVVPLTSRYDVYRQPPEMETGQLSADLANLRELDCPGAPTVGYGFVWLAALLREIGELEVG